MLAGSGPLSAGLEGADLFRTVGAGVDGIFPPAMNSPARLPTRPFWLALGWGQPLGQPWASYGAASLGGTVRAWRGAASVWHSGDDLYRETNITAAVARQVGGLFSAGASLGYASVAIPDLDHVEGVFLIGAILTAPLGEHSELSVWYAGLSLSSEKAYQSLTRQLFQLALMARSGQATRWIAAVEKTPGYELRQLAEVNLGAWRDITLQLGYRTSPGLPYAGARVPLGRTAVSLRVNLHPLFGLSTALGISFK
ncbi:MAG: hypothetical protein V3U35_05645 [Candidatus Neomarinimicrobiota bacterium]